MGFTPSGLENPGRILSRFNGASTTSIGDNVLPIQIDLYGSQLAARQCYQVAWEIGSSNDRGSPPKYQALNMIANPLLTLPPPLRWHSVVPTYVVHALCY
ncbi:hypothetical protein CK203_063961 [Vitis vinifera]|uniref:Uncharacterized protein n=1 Tax=Vitis vinifera TaxID=29760 RepID=A0A438G8N9_VITVI|nr:hypothetical protein CK203_063961 [Vitis vinifera]